MKIAFIFPSKFDILSVHQRPLGGSESAVTYLSIELAKLGHEITLISESGQISEALGVQCWSLTKNGNDIDLPKQILETQFDVIIIKNALPHLGNLLSNALPYSPLIFFWTGHASDQPAIRGLAEKPVIDHLHGIVCVSNWQKQTFIEQFKIPNQKLYRIQNAISPSFENLFVNYEEFKSAKTNYPSLVYTPTPFRGLDILLQLFPLVSKQVSSATLDIYSSMKVYGIDLPADDYQNLYQLAQKTLGVNYIGSLPQVKLAANLRKKTIFSYPNTFPETSCISVMEALAAGLIVLTTELAALPETVLNFGELVPREKLSILNKDGFLHQLIEICDRQLKNPEAFFKKAYEQVEEMNINHTWRIRAREWIQLISKIKNATQTKPVTDKLVQP